MVLFFLRGKGEWSVNGQWVAWTAQSVPFSINDMTEDSHSLWDDLAQFVQGIGIPLILQEFSHFKKANNLYGYEYDLSLIHI